MLNVLIIIGKGDMHFPCLLWYKSKLKEARNFRASFFIILKRKALKSPSFIIDYSAFAPKFTVAVVVTPRAFHSSSVPA